MQRISASKLLNISSEILNCDQLNLQLADNIVQYENKVCFIFWKI